MRRGVKISFQKISRLALTTVVLIIVSGTALSSAGARPMCASPDFYPSSPTSLYDQVESFSRPCGARLSGTPLVIIVPSDAYLYVGALLGQAYTAVSASKYDRIIILGPDDRANPVSVYSGPNLVTPMGSNPVDNQFCKWLLEESPEHFSVAEPGVCLPRSIEIQLPFLQRHFSRVPVVPIGIEGLDATSAAELGRTLAGLTANSPTLYIAVSNLSSSFDIGACESGDNRLIEKLQSCNFAQFSEEIESGTISVESPGTMISAISSAVSMGGNSCRILRYENTGRITGDHQRVCGYLTAVILADNGSEGVSFEISEEVGDKLLKHARSTIEIGAGRLSPVIARSEIPENLPIDGVHIDIIIDGRESGLGIMRPEGGVYQAIRNAAHASAFNDPRYNPLGKAQTYEMKLKLYLIGNLRRLSSIDDFEPKQDGVWISHGSVSAKVFPWEMDQSLKKEDVLGRICLKAGLFSDCWKDPYTEIRVFDTQVFEEER